MEKEEIKFDGTIETALKIHQAYLERVKNNQDERTYAEVQAEKMGISVEEFNKMLEEY